MQFLQAHRIECLRSNCVVVCRFPAKRADVRVTANNGGIHYRGRKDVIDDLRQQCEMTGQLDFLEMPYHKSILNGEIEALKDGVRKVNHDTLDSLSSEVGHLSKIVNDLHELSLADSGGLAINKVPVDAVAVLKETLGLFNQGFVDNQVAIENNLENQPAIIIGDASRLQQLFSNLLENTLRYADTPGVLKIGQERAQNRLILFFEDSGPGVPKEALEQLFDRLYRVDRSRSRTLGGSGLGLSICKSIVTALGGEIQATNGNSGGLRIEVALPLTG